MRKLTHEEEKQIIELYVQQKKSSLEVSKLVGYSATLVTKVIKRRGFEVRSISKAMSGKKRPNSFPVSKIIKHYNDGMSSYQIADKIGCSRTSVTKILKQEKIKLRSSSDYEKGRTDLKSDIISKYTDGMSLKEVASDLGVSYGCVRGWLEKEGIIRTELKNTYNGGGLFSEESLDKFRETKTKNKESGLHDHIYLARTGYTYKEFQSIRPKFKKYHQKVRSITNKQDLQSLSNFDKRGKAGEDGAYHLDHKYSIAEGFRNDVNPEIIGNIANLEMIPWEENMMKNDKCSISLKELQSIAS